MDHETPSPPEQKERLGALDGLRAMAILLVVVCHASITMQGRLGYSYEIFGTRFVAWFMTNGWVGVELFFVLSGFLITRQLLPAFGQSEWKAPVGRYLKRRFFRIAPAYYFIMTLIGLMVLVQRWPLGSDGLLTWLQIYVHHLLFLPAGFINQEIVYWSLVTEVRFYLIAPLLVLALPQLSLRTRAAFLLAVILVLSFTNAALALQNPPANHTAYLVTLIIPFRSSVLCCLAGMLCCLLWSDEKFRQALKPRLRANLMFGAGLALFFCLTAATVPYLDHGGKGLNFFSLTVQLPMIALAFSLMLLGLLGECSCRRLFEGRLLRGIALISYSMYLVHNLFIDTAWVFAEKWAGHGAQATTLWLAMLAAVLAYTLPLAVLSYYLVEKPFIDWAHGKRAHKTAV